MDLTNTSKFLGAIGIALAAMANLAAAQTLTVLETKTCEFPVSLTDWQSSCQIDFYDGNRTLEEVMITLDGGADSDVTITAGTDANVERGEVGADINASWSISGQNLSLNALPTGDFAPPAFTVPGGTVEAVADISGTDQDMLIETGATNPNVAIYNGTGTFTVDVAATGFIDARIRGGNNTTEQATDAFATLTVQYKGTPEPNGSLMATFAFLGLVGFRRRR